jgi:hypothetical protein
MHLRSLCAVAVVLAMAAPAAAGTVSGTLELPPGMPERPPVRGKAFVDRTPNPLTPVRAVDPLPLLIVALEPAPTTQYAPPAPAAVMWDLLGESFARKILPVRIGGEVRIRNKGRSSPVLVAAGKPTLLIKKPLNPTAEITFVPGTEPGAIEIIDEASPHLRARIVVMPSPFFATVNAKKEWSIANVPEGDWVVKVWYDTGWLDRADEKIHVEDKKLDDLTLKLPAGWSVKKK